MSEEEITKVIDECTKLIDFLPKKHISGKYIQKMLDIYYRLYYDHCELEGLYQNEKVKNRYYEDKFKDIECEKIYENLYKDIVKMVNKDYICKDKVKKALKEIEENDYNCYDSCLVLRELLGED